MSYPNLVHLLPDGVPQFVHLLSHFLEEVCVRLFWRTSTSSVTVYPVVSVDVCLVLFLLQPLPHLLVLPGKFFHHGCERLDLQSQRSRVLASGGFHLDR